MYKANLDGLTGPQEAFAKYLALGETQSDAYRKAHKNSFKIRALSPQAIAERAHRWANRPLIKTRAETWLREAKCSDLQTAGDWMQDLLDGIAKAKAAANWTAFAALKRLSGQALGTIRDTVLVREEQSMSDETLVRQLAKADPQAAATLQRLLGRPIELKRAA